MTAHSTPNPAEDNGFARRLRVTLYAVPVIVAAAGVAGLATALEARSLLVTGALLIGWSQLVGL